MIVILSQEQREVSTEQVIDWLEAYDEPYRRVNGEDVDGKNGFAISCTGNRLALEESPVDVPTDDVDVVWYRRWQHHRDYWNGRLLNDAIQERRDGEIDKILALQLNKELKRVSECFFDLFDDATWLSLPERNEPNKMHVLRAAARHGLTIPDSIIADNRAAVVDFAAPYDQIITKVVSNACYLPVEDGTYLTYTEALDHDAIASLPERFFPALFQERVVKQYEIRVFVLDGTCYPMAIFSQEKAQTEVDFRRYDYEQPNRCVPYRLPDETEAHLLALMDDLGYVTGSVDFMMSTDGELVFLEINPVGQFGMVSEPCNYHLERAVAQYLRKARGAETPAPSSAHDGRRAAASSTRTATPSDPR